jgi:predicted O-methyltransferase YrrM
MVCWFVWEREEMRSLKHWTPRYLYDRARNIVSNRLHREWPWLTPAAVRFLDLWLRPSDEVFEWGAGRSTLWLARRVHSITSLETNVEWFARLRSILERERLSNVDLKFFSPVPDRDDAGAYVSSLAEAHGPFDLIIVDGLYRDQCALSATGQIKPGGLLLVDNINWYLPSGSGSPASRQQQDGPASPLWADFTGKVRAWRQIWTSNGVTDTAIWVKPSQAYQGHPAAHEAVPNGGRLHTDHD